MFPPKAMKRADGTVRYAYVTFLLFNLSHKYVESAVLMAYMLRRQNTQADLVCMVTPGMPFEAKIALELVFDHVIQIDPIFIPHKRRHYRPDCPFLFTRLSALRLGQDGDLGFRYEKIVILDADVLPLRHYDLLFALNTPAGIINEEKKNLVEYDEHGHYIIPNTVYTEGKWNWHQIYEPICPHSQLIPQEFTDRVAHDPTNLGIIGALFVMEPSLAELKNILEDVKRPEISRLVGDLFDLPDMQYLTMRYSGQWTNVDVRFCGLSGYPNLSVLYGTHYAGNVKPWSVQNKGLNRYARYEDFQFWYKVYQEMMNAYPELKKLKRFKNLLEQIRTWQTSNSFS